MSNPDDLGFLIYSDKQYKGDYTPTNPPRLSLCLPSQDLSDSTCETIADDAYLDGLLELYLR